MKRRVLILLLGMSLPVMSAANDGGYLSANLSRVTYKESGVSDAHPLTAGLRVGSALTEHFSLEARLGLGIRDDAVGGVDLELDNYLGAYTRFIAPVSDSVAVYALVGIARAKLTASNGFVSASDTEKGLSYGIGAELATGPRGFVTLEYGRLVSGDDYDLDILTLGLGRRF